MWKASNAFTDPDPLIDSFDEYVERLISGSAEELKAAAYASPVVHFALFCQIRDENHQIIEPRPNILQLRINEAYETLKALGVRVRILVTKPRRAGCSSFVEHVGYHEAMRRPIEGLTIADDKEGSKAAMAKLQSYGEYDQFDWGVAIEQDSATVITWTNGSKWTVDTARNPDAGAGDTRQFGHFSETSKWPKTQTLNDSRTMTCAMPTFSGTDTTAISESTPEGAFGWQFETWGTAIWLDEFLARWKAGIRPEEQWIKVFAGWYEFEKNCRVNPCTAAEIAEMRATLTPTEKQEIRLYKLTWEQVAWRRDTIQAKCDGDEKIFAFYYPSDPESCWLASGSPRFDMARLVEWEKLATGVKPAKGYLVTQDNGVVGFQPAHDGSGDITIWEGPQQGLKYVVVIDPAESKSQTIGADPDRHAVKVWRAGYFNRDLGKWQRAKLVARVAPPFYGEEEEVAAHAVRLSRYYGQALVAQETNKGFHCLRLLQEAGVPLYKRRPISHRTGKVEEQYGFKTDQNNREAILSALATAVSNDDLEICCPHTIGEYKTFIRKENGRSEAANGKHDDDVMADAIAWEVLPSASVYKIEEAHFPDPADDRGWREVVEHW